MSEPSDPTSSGPESVDMHWALHLREDLRDVRSEIRGLHTRFDGMNTRFDALSNRLESHLRSTMMAMIAMTGVIAALIRL